LRVGWIADVDAERTVERVRDLVMRGATITAVQELLGHAIDRDDDAQRSRKPPLSNRTSGGD
jgi:hypothetical protein